MSPVPSPARPMGGGVRSPRHGPPACPVLSLCLPSGLTECRAPPLTIKARTCGRHLQEACLEYPPAHSRTGWAGLPQGNFPAAGRWPGLPAADWHTCRFCVPPDPAWSLCCIVLGARLPLQWAEWPEVAAPHLYSEGTVEGNFGNVVGPQNFN